MSHSNQDLAQSTTVDAHPDRARTKEPRPPLPMALFGTNASFSHNVFKRIMSTNLDIRAIFCDSPEPFYPHLGFDLHKLDPPPPLGQESDSLINEIRLHTDPDFSTSTIIDLGWKHNIPVYSIGRIRSQSLADTLEALNVEVACAACFNKKIPPSLLRIPKLGFLNLHPSMLPKYRGPEPIQWILHDGAQGGVTAHWMDENFDTGDIALQKEVDLDPSMSYFRAENICAAVGANVFLEVFVEIINGNVPRTPQGDDGFYRGRIGH